jgi:hypothetical protein
MPYLSGASFSAPLYGLALDLILKYRIWDKNASHEQTLFYYAPYLPGPTRAEVLLHSDQWQGSWQCTPKYQTRLERFIDPGRPFLPSLIFVNKARTLPQRGTPESCFSWAGSGLTQEYKTRLENPATNEHSGLISGASATQKTMTKTVTRLRPNVSRSFYRASTRGRSRASSVSSTPEKSPSTR